VGINCSNCNCSTRNWSTLLSHFEQFSLFRQLVESSWSRRLTGLTSCQKVTFLNGSSKTIKILTIKWNTLFCITSTIIFVQSWTTFLKVYCSGSFYILRYSSTMALELNIWVERSRYFYILLFCFELYFFL